MKKTLNIIFPWKLQMNILQLEEYNFSWFLGWLLKNFLTRSTEVKKPLVVTQKVKQILAISFLLLILIGKISLILVLILITQPYILYGVALQLIKPYELLNKKLTIKKTRDKILRLKRKGLKIIAITGSYGKTSTKEILYQILRTKYKVLKTPESYNTIFGISKVVDLELDNTYDYFICEMSIHSYKQGNIKELTYMIPPDFGLLTGITTQHAERIGNLALIKKIKFELFENVPDKSNFIFNLSDKNVSDEVKKRNIEDPQDFAKISEIKFSKTGSEFSLNKNKVVTQIFGLANIKNISASISMALKLGMKASEIISAIKKLAPVANRFVLKQLGNATLVDNTYSSNPQGFEETINSAKLVSGKKVLVTPGIVEQGEYENEVHERLGKLAAEVFDKIILVGKSSRTESLASGIKDKNKYEFIEDKKTIYQSKIAELSQKYDWLFLENDLTQNY